MGETFSDAGRILSLVKWTADLSVGIPEIDSQHRGLIDLINELYEAIVDFRGQTVIAQTLERLVLYADEHFTHEEGCMRDCAFAGYPNHKKVHEVFTQRVMDLKVKAEEADFIMSVEILEFLRDWLVQHIRGLDQKYRPCIVAQRKKS